ncbi:MAG: hypothetical protein DDT25_00179 [Chloroflexi bacterium]|nr:hypothetical protein [Chloroflexota bacterium]
MPIPLKHSQGDSQPEGILLQLVSPSLSLFRQRLKLGNHRHQKLHYDRGGYVGKNPHGDYAEVP